MISNRKDAFEFIAHNNGKTKLNQGALKDTIKVLQDISSEEGLKEEEIDQLIKFITNTKLAASVAIGVLSCLIPEFKISSKSLQEILLWFFVEAGNKRITTGVQKKFIHWLIGLVNYELIDEGAIDTYYHSFIFLMRKSHLEVPVCHLLTLMSKPEDAKRWVVRQILEVQSLGGSKKHTNAFLSSLKSFAPHIVPETVPYTKFFHNVNSFDESMKKAHERKFQGKSMNETLLNVDNLRWDTWNIYDAESKRLSRLIPAVASSMNINNWNVGNNRQKSIREFKSMVAVGAATHRIECPAESLSLLTNLAGFHVLAFSNIETKNRFSHKLYHTLYRVFILELQPYSNAEKINFLNSIIQLQEYTHQSIPIASTFLYEYLSSWDGEEYRDQIFGLIEWLDINEEEDLKKYVFPQIRQVFMFSGPHVRCLIVETMAKLMRNLFIMNKREKNFFKNDFEDFDLTKCIKSISFFVSELIVIGLIWNNEKKSRNFLMTSLSFYETCQSVEQAGDLPLMIMLPTVLVYGCLLSSSRVCVAKLCSLLVSLQMTSVERLHLMGVYEDFALEVQRLNIYMLDCYRALWSSIHFQKDEDSFFLFNTSFCKMFWDLKKKYGNVIENILGMKYNYAFSDHWSKGMFEAKISKLSEDYPSILQLKQVVEDRLLQEPYYFDGNNYI